MIMTEQSVNNHSIVLFQLITSSGRKQKSILVNVPLFYFPMQLESYQPFSMFHKIFMA